jgi:hypothetical protein
MDIKQLEAKYEQMTREELYALTNNRCMPMFANPRKSALISDLISNDIEYYDPEEQESLEYWLAFDL